MVAHYHRQKSRKIGKIIVILMLLGVRGYLLYNSFQSGEIQSLS